VLTKDKMSSTTCSIASPHLTSHGENGSRPQRPLYPRNNDRITHYWCIKFYTIIQRFPMPWRSALQNYTSHFDQTRIYLSAI